MIIIKSSFSSECHHHHHRHHCQHHGLHQHHHHQGRVGELVRKVQSEVDLDKKHLDQIIKMVVLTMMVVMIVLH